MSETTIDGRCLCGAVGIKGTVETHAHACHCGTCRRWSGGPALSARAVDVTFSGEAHIKAYPSSDWAERGFCTECGTNLFYRMRDGSMTVVWLGTVDDVSDFTLGGEIYVDKKPEFYALAGDHPRQTAAEFEASLGEGGD